MENRAVQMIDGDGKFNPAEVEQFMQATGLSNCGNSYVVVSIMGPQSSGKSTLLNHLFQTKFREMDAINGRGQTTLGVWVAKPKCAAEKPFMVAMDIEGADGRERGPDDTAFEKQSALFALAISDIVMINMWCHDVGREQQGACKPLLRTVFEVMMRIYSARKITLLFVLRDRTKTPLEHLEQILRKDTEQIWKSVCQPTIHVNTPLSEYFNVEVTALPNFELQEELFKEQVAQLRQLLLNRTKHRDGQAIVPASEFCFIAQRIWEEIKDNKDLNLPSHKVLVATVRCEEIANQKLQQLHSDKHLLALQRDSQSGSISGFGSKLSSILENYLSEYDKEVLNFDEGVRTEKRRQLISKALDFMHPAYLKLLNHLCSEAFESFKHQLEKMLNRGEGFSSSVKLCSISAMSKFDKGSGDLFSPLLDAAIRQANWDTSDIREKLCNDISNEKLPQWKDFYKKRFNGALSKQLKSIFQSADGYTWVKVRELLTCEMDHMSASISGFELDLQKRNKLVLEMRDFARDVVVIKAREGAANVELQMRNRFITSFPDSVTRFDKDIDKMIRHASIEPLKVLSVMAAIRLKEKSDEIENTLFSLLDEESGHSKTLSSKHWPEISPEDTLITPLGCRALWRGFKEGIDERFEEAKWVKFKNGTKKFLVGTFNVAQITLSAAAALSGLLIPPIPIPLPRGTQALQTAIDEAVRDIAEDGK